jgi:hypothetical protein
MADDEHDEGEAAYQQNYHAAMQELMGIRAALAPHCKTQEELHEAMRLAVKQIADPAGYEQEKSWIDQAHARAQAELARREGEQQQKIDKLRAAYHNFERLPHSHEKVNYQTALRSMLERYGEQP